MPRGIRSAGAIGRAVAVGTAIAIGLIGLAGAYSPAHAELVDADSEFQIYVWPRWQKGFDLGVRALGRFGAGSNINTPPGDLLIQLSGHVWYKHLLGFHASLGVGASYGTFAWGGGTRVNLLEFIEDPTREMIVRGLQRGLLARILNNFMLYVSFEYLRLSFPDPDTSMGLSYEADVGRFLPGVGVQWYFYVKNKFAGRFYLDTSVSYTKISQSNYFLPLVTLGAELL